MSHVVMLGSDQGLVHRTQSIPGHRVTALDREEMDALARINGLESVLTSQGGVLADVVFFGTEIPVAESMSMAESISFMFPTIELVLVADLEDDLVLRAMRSGFRDIVAASIAEDELKVLLHRVSESATRRISSAEPIEEASDPHRVIVVASPKGGVGRSTIATNLAVELAKGAPMETVLVDLDFQFGNVATLLDLDPVHTIDDAFETTASLDTLILKTFLTVHPAGFYVLCGAVSPTLGEDISTDQVMHLLRQLSSQFANIVVDTSAGVDEITLNVIDAATDLILVSSMDITSTTALRKELEVLSQLDVIPPARHILLNFADRHSGVDIRQVEATIGAPVEVIVPRSLEVVVAANLGQTVISSRSRSSVAKAIRQLASRVRADLEPEIRSKHRGMEVA